MQLTQEMHGLMPADPLWETSFFRPYPSASRLSGRSHDQAFCNNNAREERQAWRFWVHQAATWQLIHNITSTKKGKQQRTHKEHHFYKGFSNPRQSKNTMKVDDCLGQWYCHVLPRLRINIQKLILCQNALPPAFPGRDVPCWAISRQEIHTDLQVQSVLRGKVKHFLGVETF